MRKEGIVEQRRFQNSWQLVPLPREYNDRQYIEVVDNAYSIIVMLSMFLLSCLACLPCVYDMIIILSMLVVCL